jgi:hypothetical protein
MAVEQRKGGHGPLMLGEAWSHIKEGNAGITME